MKPSRKTGFDRRTQVARDDKGERRKEALVLLAIAVLFVANVILYLCHHYGFTSANQWRSPAAVAPRVMVD